VSTGSRCSWVGLGLSVATLAVLPACSVGAGAADEPARPSVPTQFSATFEVESPSQLVAGEGQAWILTPDGNGAALSRVDHTGRSDEVLRSPGRWHDMAPHADGVVVSRIACGGEDCVETVTTLLVLDRQGSTVSEHELAREPGWPDYDRGGELIGVSEDVAWLNTSDGLLAYDVQAGRTLDRGEVPDGLAAGFICLLGEGLYTVGPADTRLPTEVRSDDSYGAVVRRLVDGNWQPVPGSQRTLTAEQLSMPECVGGALGVGRPATAGPAWSPSSGWEDREPALEVSEVGALTARGPENQLFVLERPGVVRRVFGGPEAPMSAETLEVPADIFVPPVGPYVTMLFDASATALVGCVQQYGDQSAQPAADCWIGSVDG
jgi:hypothetical protein